MKLWKKCIMVFFLIAMMAPAFGCSEEGEMEKAGKKVDQAAEDAADKAKKLFE
jgi:hypothetical protein